MLSWPKLSLEPKFHDSGIFFTFFAIDRLGAPNKDFLKIFLQKSYFYLKRAEEKYGRESILLKHESCLSVCYQFPQPPKVS